MWFAIILFVATTGLCEGRSSNIINGGDVDYPGKYPWQASLQYYKYNNWHSCGASIVSPRWLVTAAHCIKGVGAAERHIVVGMHDQDLKFGKPVSHAISRLIPHVGFKGNKTQMNDIGLIELQTDIEYNEYVQPIAVANKGDIVPGTTCVITGWGRTDQSVQGRTEILQESSTTLLSEADCHKQNDIVCVKNGVSGICSGDSGGPLACKRDDTSSTWLLLGATSYSINKCSVAYPSMYTDVTFWIDWITSYTGPLNMDSCPDVPSDYEYDTYQDECQCRNNFAWCTLENADYYDTLCGECMYNPPN